VREWAQRTNRDDRASTLGATRVPGNVYRYWPDPTNDEAELDAWLFRTSAQRWCVGVGWGFELLRDQVAATEARESAELLAEQERYAWARYSRSES